MSGTIQIYEFSRAFDNIQYSSVYKSWVSGGYSPDKITSGNKDVPPEIASQVRDGYFAMNDNYPPEPGEIALIAREIETEHTKYAVLAVANRQIDDGGRPTIGYRYFWLKNSEPLQIDGIGTLIWWWKKVKLKFDMSPSMPNTPLQSTVAYSIPDVLKHPFFSDIRNSVTEIRQLPEFRTLDSPIYHHSPSGDEFPEFLFAHWCSLGIVQTLGQSSPNRSLAWAYNVKRLSHPSDFVLVYASSSEALRAMVPRTPQLLPAQNTLAGLSDDKRGSISYKNFPQKDIKEFLRGFSKSLSYGKTFNPEDVNKYFNCLASYKKKLWQIQIDETTMGADTEDAAAYRSVIYFGLSNDNLEEQRFRGKCINDLIDSVELPRKLWSTSNLFSSNNGQGRKKYLAIQQDIREREKSLQHIPDIKFEVDNRIKLSIFYGISALLKRALYSSDDHLKIHYILSGSESYWSDHFQSYLLVLEKVSNDQNPKECDLEDEERNSVREFLKELEKYMEAQNGHQEKRTNKNTANNLLKLFCLFEEEPLYDDISRIFGLEISRRKANPKISSLSQLICNPSDLGISIAFLLGGSLLAIVAFLFDGTFTDNSNYPIPSNDKDSFDHTIISNDDFLGLLNREMNHILGPKHSRLFADRFIPAFSNADFLSSLNSFREYSDSHSEQLNEAVKRTWLSHSDPQHVDQQLDTILTYLQHSNDANDYRDRKGVILLCMKSNQPLLQVCLDTKSNPISSSKYGPADSPEMINMMKK